MKMTRKLIPAFVMLLVSAILLSTASYAWFASNTTVEATSMTVKANTDVVFLQITNDKESGSWGKSAEALTTSSGDLDLVTAEITDGTAVVWKTAEGSDPTKYDAATGDDDVADYTTLGSITSQYALINTFYVRMSNDESTLTNLKIAGVAVEGESVAGTFDESIRVLVIAKDSEENILGIQCWDVGTGDFINNSADVLADEVAGDPITLEVYVYYDGEDTEAYTNNNLDAIGQRNISVSFTATEA